MTSEPFKQSRSEEESSSDKVRTTQAAGASDASSASRLNLETESEAGREGSQKPERENQRTQHDRNSQGESQAQQKKQTKQVKQSQHAQQTQSSQRDQKSQTWWGRFGAWRDRHKLRLDYVPLTARLVNIVFIILLIAGVFMTIAAQQLVFGALMSQTNTQLHQQATSIRSNVAMLQKQVAQRSDILNFSLNSGGSTGQKNGSSGIGREGSAPGAASGNDDTTQALRDFLDAQETNIQPEYFLQIRDAKNNVLATPFTAVIGDNLIAVPSLPVSGKTSPAIVVDGSPVTVPSRVKVISKNYTAESYNAASANWQVMAISIRDADSGKMQYIVYVAKSLYWVNDATNKVVRYFSLVSLAVIVCGAVLSLVSIRRALLPLKRIEKTAAQIAAGDLTKRVPQAPVNTEIGSLSASLNSMLSRIESSFKGQEEITEQMKRFVSDASHELRTPLAAIHGYAELYKMQRQTPGAQERADEVIDRIEASSTRMTSLVESLLSLARMDEGRGIDLAQRVRVDQLVEKSAEDLHALDPQRKITIGRVAIDQNAMLNEIAAVTAQRQKGAAAQEIESESEHQKGRRRSGRQDKNRSDKNRLDKGRQDKAGYDKTLQDDMNVWETARQDRSRQTMDEPTLVGTDRLRVVEPAPAEITIGGDPTRLRQVLTNIIGNIHRYTPADSPVEIGVSVVKAVTSTGDLSKFKPVEEALNAFLEDVAIARKTQAGREFVIIRISDHGPGVAPDKIPKIFERFYTTDPSRARQKGGSGLGMSIALAVVKAHHGFICASTTDGGGLSFAIVIPASQTRVFLDRNDRLEQGTSVVDARKNRKAQKKRKKLEKQEEESITQIVYGGQSCRAD